MKHMIFLSKMLKNAETRLIVHNMLKVSLNVFEEKNNVEIKARIVHVAGDKKSTADVCCTFFVVFCRFFILYIVAATKKV